MRHPAHGQEAARPPNGGTAAPGVSHRLFLPSVVVGLTLSAISAAVVAASLAAASQARARLVTFSSGAPLVVPDPRIGYVSPPDSTTRRRHEDGIRYTYHRDGRGARVAAPGTPTPSDVDVVFVGGSFTLGRGVEHEQTFAARAAAAWDASMANLGTGAYGTVQSLLVLERFPELSPDLVVYGFIEDHIRRNLSPCAPSLLPFCVHVPHVRFDGSGRPSIRLPDPRAAAADWRRNERFREAARSPPLGVGSAVSGFELLAWGAHRMLSPPREPRLPPEARSASLAYLLRSMSAVVADRGGRLAVVYIPDLSGTDPARDPPPGELLAALGGSIELVDVSRALAGRRGPPLAIPGDGHPSAAGHAAIADALVAQLRLPDRSESPSPP